MKTPPRSLFPAVLAASVAFSAPVALAAGVGLDLSGRDTTCAPCKDFFQYANGVWVTRTEIPASYPGTGSFQQLRDQNEETLHALLDDAVRQVTSAPAGSNAWLLGTFYGSCMDSMR